MLFIDNFLCKSLSVTGEAFFDILFLSMFSSRKKTKTVIRISDNSISVLTLGYNQANKLDVLYHEDLGIPAGIIVSGEILKLEVLAQILKKIKSKIGNTSVDVLLPHEHFHCSQISLDPVDKKTALKKRVKDYFQTKTKNEPWHKTHACEFQHYPEAGEGIVLFRCLPKEAYKSYLEVFKRAGLVLSALNSDILAFDHLLGAERTSLVHIQGQQTQIADFKKKVHVGLKKFELSYSYLIDDILRNIDMKRGDAKKILEKYGALRSHRDPIVYKRLLRSFSPLVDFLKRRKTQGAFRILVVFGLFPLPGFADHIRRYINVPMQELNLFLDFGYDFVEVPGIHKKHTYRYQAHIAQALRSFEKKEN